MRIQRWVDLISLRHNPSGLTNNRMTAWVISVVRARIRCRLGLPISDIGSRFSLGCAAR